MDRQRGHGLQWTDLRGGLWKGQAVLAGTGMINKDWCELAVLVRMARTAAVCQGGYGCYGLESRAVKLRLGVYG